MFVRQKDLERLDVSSQRILRLQRSLNDVQLALPEFPPQAATAYLCAVGTGAGVRVVAALHLHASRRLVFYLDNAGAVPREKAGSLFSGGTQFVESMGFMLGELDFQHLTPEDRSALWDSLPLKTGDAGASAGAGDQADLGDEKRRRVLENLGRFLASF